MSDSTSDALGPQSTPAHTAAVAPPRHEPATAAGPHFRPRGSQSQPAPLAAEQTQTGRASASDFQLTAVNLVKSYRKGPIAIPVLKGVGIDVRKGEFLAIVGQSGSGKSTLLHLLGTLDVPDSGEIYFDGQRIDTLPGRGRDRLRNQSFGMIFQFYHLLPELTTLENVLAPLMITHSTLSYWRHRRRLRTEAAELLDMVGLGHRLKHKPRELSGGEMQRAAIAR
ncbi:MAG: ATP-binding cassette domain-containing protein, partial [Candidatus Nealsonbacteria bacterium]|nr:ATP-binding cassette domain-containing protein [Candidatus Nealsonbacteria bacterium]